jgi:hypothetical protein
MKIFGYKKQIEIPLVDNYFEGEEGNIVIQDFNINFFIPKAKSKIINSSCS